MGDDFNTVMREASGAEVIGRRGSMKALKVFVGLLGLVWSVLCIAIPVSLSQTLAFNNQQGERGDTVSFTLRIEGAPNRVEAFGFDVIYDPEVLQYTGSFSQEEMVSGFNFFNVNELSPGRARVAGFSVKNLIEAGGVGPVVTLEFTVINPGSTTLSVANLVDDVAGWSTQAGRFEGLTTRQSADSPEEIARQSVTDQSEEGGLNTVPQAPAESSEGKEEETVPKPVTTVSQQTTQAASSRSSTASAQSSQRPTAGVSPRLSRMRMVKKSENAGRTVDSRKNENVASSQRPVGLPTPGSEAVGKRGPGGAALPSREPWTTGTAEPAAAPNPTSVAVPAERQRMARGDRQTLQQTAKLGLKERPAPSRESSGERAFTQKSSNSDADTGLREGDREPSAEGGFLSPTARTVMLFGILVVLCVVGVLLVSLKRR